MTGLVSRTLREHVDALAAMLDSLTEASLERWDVPRAPGKWTPGEIAEHLILVYEGAVRDLEGGTPARARVGPGWQRTLRWFVLPHVLFHRSFPMRVRAPREWRPGEERMEPEAAIRRLADAAHLFEQEAVRAHEEARPLRHPYFGCVDALRALRLAAVHLEHHRRQVLSCLGPVRVV